MIVNEASSLTAGISSSKTCVNAIYLWCTAFTDCDTRGSSCQQHPLWVEYLFYYSKESEEGCRVLAHTQQQELMPSFVPDYSKNVVDGWSLGKCYSSWLHSVTKLSQPQVHKVAGPTFKFGECIIKACRLEPVTYPTVSQGTRKRPAGSQPAGPRAKQTRRAVYLEPDSNSRLGYITISRG